MASRTRCRCVHTSAPWSACWSATRIASSEASRALRARSGRQLTITAAGHSHARVASSAADSSAASISASRRSCSGQKTDSRPVTRTFSGPSSSRSSAWLSSVTLSSSTAPYGRTWAKPSAARASVSPSPSRRAAAAACE